MLYTSLQYEAFLQRSLAQAMVEERRRYCELIDGFASVFKSDCGSAELRRALDEALHTASEPDKLTKASRVLLEQTGSNGLMLEAPSIMQFQQARSSPPPQRPTSAGPKLVASPLTQEYAQRVLPPPPEYAQRILPPGCPVGGGGWSF